MALLDRVGPRNVVFETDYPHQDGTWPHSVEAAAEQFGNQAPEIVNRLARGNAIELLGLDLPLDAPRV
jgi:predicted TIM-barrel fold metal-dependent hydrolase